MAEAESLQEQIARERTEMLDRAAEIEAQDFGPPINEVVIRVAEEAETPRPWIPTGFRPLDNLLDGGLRGGEVMVLAARPSVGKSALALQIILHATKYGHSVGLWTIEMSHEQWVRRGIVALSGVPARAIRMGTMSDPQQTEFARAANHIHGIPIRFGGSVTEPGRWAAQAEIMTEDGCELLVIDYLQLMDPPKAAYNRENEVAVISRTIKRTAVKLDVPVLLLAQLNRNAEGKPPTMADLRESGAIEQDSDEIFFLHRDRDTDRHVLSPRGMGILAKNRDGETGSFPIEYDPRRFRFMPIDGMTQDTRDHHERREVA